MISMSLQKAAEILAVPPIATDGGFEGITTDSRRVSSGMMFAALGGEHADGHDFVSTALADGATAALVSRKLDLPIPQLLVDDVITALGSLAAQWCTDIKPVVVAITGSNGKTTSKEMVAKILEINASVLATSGNYNNELGLPLTLFELSKSHEFAVLELGASKAGDIEYLSNICAPGIGLVTNVGPAHLQGFGNEEGVARAKGELYAALPATGTAIINNDESWAGMWQEMCPAKNCITFGHKPGSDVFPLQTSAGVKVQTPQGEFELRLHLPGDHNLQNALAATSVALALNIPVEQIRAGLENTQPVPGRLNLVYTQSGWTAIDDTYNANPASLYAALQVLSLQQGEPWLVLGDMKELGDGSRKMHAEMGEAARALGVKKIFAIGDASQSAVEAFGPGGRHFDSHASLIEALCSELGTGIACLVKGSRSMGMEQVVEAITDPYPMRGTG